MQSSFAAFLQLGFEHISDLEGYDHILFIVALCAVYKPSEWKKVAILVTAFTIGHSLTLALAALNILKFPGSWIEFLIPLTILATAIFNVFRNENSPGGKHGLFNRQLNLNYLFALLFGLIHGMGFSNFFRASMLPGEENAFLSQLLAFNIGVELGQLLIVAFILLGAFFGMQILNIRKREWNLFISGAAAGLAFVMALERIPWA